MRLSAYYQQTIINETQRLFGITACVYLFGSRVDDTKKGGDIDLYIETTRQENLFDKKIALLMALHKQLGEQKIDIIINDFSQEKMIYTIAKQTGIKL